MKKILEIRKTSPACPEQYEGRLDTGELFYVRCRFGQAELRVGTQEQWEAWKLPTVVHKEYPNSHPGEEFNFKGEFEPGELKELFTEGNVEFDDTKEILEYMPDPLEMLRKLEEVMKSKKDEEGTMFLTMDEDFLRGTVSSNAQLQLLAEVQSKSDKIEITNLFGK